jgi:hypothetical protein
MLSEQSIRGITNTWVISMNVEATRSTGKKKGDFWCTLQLAALTMIFPTGYRRSTGTTLEASFRSIPSLLQRLSKGLGMIRALDS